MKGAPSGIWPTKKCLFGVEISVTRYDEVVAAVMAAAKSGSGGVATFLPVHGIVTGATNRQFRQQINTCDVVGPDGQPVRWALNVFHYARLTDRVYGPEVMRRVCQKAAEERIPIYLFGSTPNVLFKLQAKLLAIHPNLRIAGIESPPFRPLNDVENQAVCNRINQSGAGIAFIGLGCPRQEVFAQSNRDRIHAVQLCVGAAFDFLAGNKKMAPSFMQRLGMEWLFRLVSEPGRLWKRYLVTNTVFLTLVTWHAAKSPFRRLRRKSRASIPAAKLEASKA